MAFTAIPTGYVDSGPLGALWAGQNASMAENQNRMDNLADMFDIQQKQESLMNSQQMNPLLRTGQQNTNSRNEFDLSQLQRNAGNVNAVSDLTGMQARADAPNVGAMANSKLAQALQQNLTFEENKATSAGRVASAGADSSAKIYQQMAPVAQTLMNMPPESRAIYLQQLNWMDPNMKAVLAAASNGNELPKLMQSLAQFDPKHIQKMDEIKAQGDNSARSASISAQGGVDAAAKMQLGQERQELANRVAAMKGVVESIKLTKQSLASSLEVFKPEDKKSKAYKDLEQRDRDLTKMLDDANKSLIDLAAGRQPTARTTEAPVVSPPGAQVWGRGPDGKPMLMNSGGEVKPQGTF